MRQDWFKNKTKYAVSRLFDADQCFIIKEGDTIDLRPDTDTPADRVRKISDEDFVIECRVTDDRVYVVDITYYNGDVRDKEWNRRHLILRKNFDWNETVRLSHPIVVTSQDEMETSFDIMDMLPSSRGAVVIDYEDDYPSERHMIPSEEM